MDTAHKEKLTLGDIEQRMTEGRFALSHGREDGNIGGYWREYICEAYNLTAEEAINYCREHARICKVWLIRDNDDWNPFKPALWLEGIMVYQFAYGKLHQDAENDMLKRLSKSHVLWREYKTLLDDGE